MSYEQITAKSTAQYKLKEDAKSSGRYSIKMLEYYSMIDERIVIATKRDIGGIFPVSIGDYADVLFQTNNGIQSTYKCIIGEYKGPDALNVWGHDNGQTVVEVIYHNYNPPSGYNKPKNNLWGAGRVLRITINGSYYSK
jgi:hypothetical protein